MIWVEGFIKDVLVTADGKVIDYGWSHNQIQNDFAKFLAGLCKEHNFGPSTGTGINHVKFGPGLSTWFTGGSRVRDYDSRVLSTVTGSQAVLRADCVFCDPTSYEPASIVTRALRYTIVRGPTASDEIHGELGLYGGWKPGGTDERMVNWYVRDSQITKGAADTLTTTVVLKFFHT